MSKYKVGDEIVVIKNPSEDKIKLAEGSFLAITENISTFSWSLKIINVTYNEPEVTLTYENARGETNKVFAICKDIDSFDRDRVLEKALLKAYLNEIVVLSTLRDNNLTNIK